MKHNSKATLRVLLDRIAALEAMRPGDSAPVEEAPPADEDTAPPQSAGRPRLERAWTHTDASGLREGRLHRREEKDDGDRHADPQPKIRSTRRVRP